MKKKKLKKKRSINEILENSFDADQLLLDFANAKSRTTAKGIIVKDLQFWFNFETPPLDVIELYQKRLRELFDELNNEENLLKSKKIHDFTFDYLPIRAEAVIDVQEDGILGESLLHLIGRPFGEILTHFVIKMFSKPKSVILLHKCENPKCNKYFLGKKQRPINGPNRRKYCDNPKCKRFGIEQRRTKNGYHKEFKKKKREIEDPIKKPGYFGNRKGEL